MLLRQVSMGRCNLVSRSCFDFSVCLDRQCRWGLQCEQSYSHFWCTYTSGVLTLQACSHAIRELGVLVVSVTPGVVPSRLFSHALCGLVVLAVSVTPGVVSSWLISHALHGLVVLTVSVTPGLVSWRLFSHALRGLVVLVVSSRTAWSLRGSPHMSCVHSLFSGSGGCSTGHGDREVGLRREIIDCVEKNLQTSYRTLPLYFSFPLWNHSLPARLTQFLHLTS